MFLVRVILVSHIVFTVTSAACCGEKKDQCQSDCTGIVCTSDSHCGDLCCVGDVPGIFKGFCGACHKTRHCDLFIGGLCREKCCGSGFILTCLKTCDGISCSSDGDCDGECCIGDTGNKTCAPCRKVTSAPPCTRNSECTTNCCRFGKCTLKTLCPTTDRPSSAATTADNQSCTRNLDCATDCCKFGTCSRRELCSTTDKPSSPPTTELERRCNRNSQCATKCCKLGQCLSSLNCPSVETPQNNNQSPPKASSDDSVDLKKVIIIPLAALVAIVKLAVLLYCCIRRRQKRNDSRWESQSRSHHHAPHSINNGARPVSFYNDGYPGNSSGVAYVVKDSDHRARAEIAGRPHPNAKRNGYYK